MKQIIENTKPLFDEDGEVKFGGWSKFPLFEYNKDDYGAPKQLVEKDSYFISSDEMGFYISVETEGSELGIRIILIDYKTKEIVRDSIRKKLWLDPTPLPQSPNLGEFKYNDKKLAMTITNTVDGNYIKCDFIDFNNYKNLFVKVKIRETNGESMNIIAPFDKNPKSFYHKRFVPNFTADGVVRIGGKDYNLNEKNSFVYLDWSRYSLPKRQKFQMFSTVFDNNEKRVAINFASKVGNNRRGSENCYFINGKMTKVGRLRVAGDDKSNESDWEFSTVDKRVGLSFVPSKTDGKAVLCKCDNITVVFGKLNGTLADGDTLMNIDGINAHMIFTQI